MQEDYTNAASRHLRDAELLLSSKRTANASHLFGFAAECALKAMAQSTLTKNRSTSIHGHIPALFDELARLNRAGQDQGFAKAILRVKPFFCRWNVNQRYAAENDTVFSVDAINRQRDGAQHACNLMRQVGGHLI